MEDDLSALLVRLSESVDLSALDQDDGGVVGANGSHARRAGRENTCTICGVVFVSKRAHLYCSRTCEQRAYRRRKGIIGFPTGGKWRKRPKGACQTCGGLTLGLRQGRWCPTCRKFNEIRRQGPPDQRRDAERALDVSWTSPERRSVDLVVPSA